MLEHQQVQRTDGGNEVESRWRGRPRDWDAKQAEQVEGGGMQRKWKGERDLEGEQDDEEEVGAAQKESKSQSLRGIESKIGGRRCRSQGEEDR